MRSVGDKYFFCFTLLAFLIAGCYTSLLVVTVQAWSKHLKEECAPNKARLQQQQGK